MHYVNDSLLQAGIFASLLLGTATFLTAAYFALLRPLLMQWIF